MTSASAKRSWSFVGSVIWMEVVSGSVSPLATESLTSLLTP
jgi:hypothetical protein